MKTFYLEEEEKRKEGVERKERGKRRGKREEKDIGEERRSE